MSKSSLFKQALSLAIAFLVVATGSIFQATPALASHYRGSIVTVEYHADPDGDTDEVHVVSTTLTAKNDADSMGEVVVYLDGQNGPEVVSGCTGWDTPLVTDDFTNPLFDITVEAFTISDCFTTSGDYIFEAQTCCRISGVVNTPNSAIQFQSLIHINGTDDSAAPTYNSGYMYNIAYDPELDYVTNLGGLGDGLTPVTYELVTNDQSTLDGYGAEAVPCSNLNTSTGAYRINSSFCSGNDTIEDAFGQTQTYYALKVRAIDSSGQYSTRDVLLNFDTTSNQAPAFTFVPETSAFTVTPGSPSSAQFCAQDPDLSDTLNFTFSPTRSWISQGTVSVNATTDPDTYCVEFTFSPPSGTEEAFNFEVSVYDDSNTFVRSESNLYSLQAGAVLSNNASPVISYIPGNYSVEAGDELSIGAPTVSGSSVVSYSISPALPAGFSLNTASGAITGSSKELSSGTYTIVGTDAQNSAGSTSITITVVRKIPKEPVGPEVFSIEPRTIPSGVDQVVTITGDRLEEAMALVVRGQSLEIKTNTKTQLVFVMPKQAAEGEVALSFRTPRGNIAWENALVIRATVPATEYQAAFAPGRAFAATGFDPGSSYLNSTVLKQLRVIAVKIGTTKAVTCTGVTMGPTVLARDAFLAKNRAVAACNRLKTLLPKGVVFQTKNSQELELGSRIRRVDISVTD